MRAVPGRMAAVAAMLTLCSGVAMADGFETCLEIDVRARQVESACNDQVCILDAVVVELEARWVCENREFHGELLLERGGVGFEDGRIFLNGETPDGATQRGILAVSSLHEATVVCGSVSGTAVTENDVEDVFGMECRTIPALADRDRAGEDLADDPGSRAGLNR